MFILFAIIIIVKQYSKTQGPISAQYYAKYFKKHLYELEVQFRMIVQYVQSSGFSLSHHAAVIPHSRDEGRNVQSSGSSLAILHSQIRSQPEVHEHAPTVQCVNMQLVKTKTLLGVVYLKEQLSNIFIIYDLLTYYFGLCSEC